MRFGMTKFRGYFNDVLRLRVIDTFVVIHENSNRVFWVGMLRLRRESLRFSRLRSA